MSGRKTVTTSITSNKNNHTSTNLDDDWETDPNFERHMDEMDQRWGAKRTVGSINMTKLIDEVHNDHRSIMRERFLHPSQATIDKQSTSTTSKKIITSSSSTSSAGGLNGNGRQVPLSRETFDTGARGPSINEMKKTIFERNNYEKETARPVYTSNMHSTTPSTKPAYERDTDFKNRLNRFNNSQQQGDNIDQTFSKKFHESTSSKSHKILRDEIRSSSNKSPTTSPTYSETQKKAKKTCEELEDEVPKAFRSIQAKIDAYKKELDALQDTMARKANLSQKINKTSNAGTTSKVYSEQQANDIEFVDSDNVETKKSSSSIGDLGAGSIKSMREKFDSLMREDDDDFKRRTEARRKQFFDEIKNQVHETRRGLAGFDDPMDEEFEEMKRKFLERNREHLSSPKSNNSQSSQQQHSRTASKLSTPSPTAHGSAFKGSHSSLGAGGTTSPKVYTKRETHREEVVSRIVKENDKVIENETKRNVQHSESSHGSSDDEDPESIPIPITVAGQSRSTSTSPRNTPNTRSPVNKQQQQAYNSPEPAHTHRLSSSSSPIRHSQTPMTTDRRQQHKTSPIGSKSVSPIKAHGAGLMARTLYDYEAAEDDELSFDVDDLITNIEKIDSGWYKGTITSRDGSKKVGLFPANHVKLLNDDGEY